MKHGTGFLTGEGQAIQRPILFSTQMVHAILEGRKTQTRRIIKPQPDDDGLWNHTLRPMSIDPRYDMEGWWGTTDGTGESKQYKCPYGQEGDKLWVRETWQVTDFLHRDDENYGYIFKASENGSEWEANDESWTWRPSIFMPKKACRIFLQVTGVRVERIQSISYQDCLAEGIKDGIGHNADLAYRKLWESINGDCSWISNPWVWVISFMRVGPVKNPVLLTSI